VSNPDLSSPGLSDPDAPGAPSIRDPSNAEPSSLEPSIYDRELSAILGEDGLLAAALPGFRFRPQQLAMAHAVAKAIERRGALIAEAGTGTGKTFAYLVPALLYGGKVIVSTGTKTLQDQLFQRDLPTVRDTLKVPVTLALLKGRANYVCHHHLERTAADGRLPSRDDARHLPKIVAFARTSNTGDRGQLADVPEYASIWPLVTSTRDNCLGAECAFHADCFVLKARKAALEADVVVVNHHLFFADVMLRDEGLAELLPACNTVILDEAHQLSDTATLFFGEELTSGQLGELARDSEVAARAGAREVPQLPEAVAGIAPAARKLRLALGDVPAKITQQAAIGKEGFTAALDELTAALDRLDAELGLFAERSEDIAHCAERAREAAAQLARWRAGLAGSAGEAAWIRWVDVTQTGWQLHASPLSVADVFGKRVASRGGRGSSRRRRSPSARIFRCTSASSAFRMRPPVAGNLRSITRRRVCCTSRAICLSRTRASTPRRSSQRRCRCCGQAAAAHSCCSRRYARSTSRAKCWPQRWPAKSSPGRCSCRARDRAASFSPASASSAMPSCSAAQASARVWTCRARRCPW
jgi:hypothetical protein